MSRVSPTAIKGLMVLLLAVFGLLAIRTFPSTFAEGWLPTVSLISALGLIVAAMAAALRSR